MLTLPPEYHELTAENALLHKRINEIATQRHVLRKAAMEVAGWKYCCRCFPRCVDDDGFCGCCMYDHATGKKLRIDDDPEVGSTSD